MQIPSKSDWGEIDPHDLDLQWAFKNFYGKSFVEAEEMFRKNALILREDPYSMPAIPFNFYVPAYLNFITSELARGHSDAASAFLSMIVDTFRERREIMSNKTRDLLLKAAETLAQTQEFYDADVCMYGKFSDRWLEIKSLL